jgi:hypothetical protein
MDQTNDRERIEFTVARIRWSQSGDARHLGTEVFRHSFNVTRSYLGSVELCSGWENIALGGIADHLGDCIGEIRGGRVDEKIPIGIVLVSVFPAPRQIERTDSQGH